MFHKPQDRSHLENTRPSLAAFPEELAERHGGSAKHHCRVPKSRSQDSSSLTPVVCKQYANSGPTTQALIVTSVT